MMFTGIVSQIGKLHSVSKNGSMIRLEVESGAVSVAVSVGDSVAVNGACLTVTKIKNNILSFDVMEETLRTTTLGTFKGDEYVNLESSLKPDGSLGGHFVLGHVDCVGTIRRLNTRGKDASMEISIPEKYAELIVDKGSVAVDGISLTVGQARRDSFTVYLIPHTLGSTTLGSRKRGDRLNIEFDILGKYAIRSRESGQSSRITDDFLRSKGF